MSLYQCEKCGCVENTACGHYHCRDMKDMWAEEFIGKALCSACGPTHYKDGERNKECGKWHGEFEQKFYPLNSLYTDDDGNVRRKSDDKYPWEEEKK